MHISIASSLQPYVGNQSPFYQSTGTEKGAITHANDHSHGGDNDLVIAQRRPSAETNDVRKAHPSPDEKKTVESEQSDAALNKEKNPLTDPSSEAYALIKQLAAMDREVRAHEQAHLSAAGKYATGGMKFSFQAGPDGQRYAVGGEVGIDVSAIPDDPLATIAKMQVVQRAATAPAEPSGQDMRIAAQAAQTAAGARAELAAQQFDQTQGGDDADKAEQTSSFGSSSQFSSSKEAVASYSSLQSEAPAALFDQVA